MGAPQLTFDVLRTYGPPPMHITQFRDCLHWSLHLQSTQPHAATVLLVDEHGCVIDHHTTGGNNRALQRELTFLLDTLDANDARTDTIAGVVALTTGHVDATLNHHRDAAIFARFHERFEEFGVTLHDWLKSDESTFKSLAIATDTPHHFGLSCAAPPTFAP